MYIFATKVHIKTLYGSLCLTIEKIPPVITKDPINTEIILVNNYTNASLACEADGASFYTWEKQSDVIPPDSTGVTTNILSLVNLQPEDAGNYRCVAINGTGSIKSHYAMVTVLGK